MTDKTGLRFTAKIGGLPEDSFAVADFTLEEALNRPFSLLLNLACARTDIDFAEVLDQPCHLKIWYNGELQHHLRGIISEFSRGDSGFHRTRCTVLVRPALWRASLRRSSRIFQAAHPRHIIETLLRENGILFFRFYQDKTTAKREYCVQYRETDLEFITRLAAEEGMCFYYQLMEGAPWLIFTDHPQAMNSAEPLFYTPANQSLTEGAYIRRFHYREAVRTAQVTLRDHTFRNPDYSLECKKDAGQALAHQRGSYEHYDFPGRYKHYDSGQLFTAFQLDALRADAVTAQAEGICPQLHPGVRFYLQEHPDEAVNCRWQVVSSRHSGRQPQALEEEGGSEGTFLHSEVQLIPGSTPWREPAKKPVVYGPQEARVTGPGTEEVYCDEHGRVRIKFPWDRTERTDDTTSCWVRVCQGWAGTGYGIQAVPRVGNEVLVSFTEGDPDQPLITGRLHHVNNRPPHALPEHRTRTVIRTETVRGKGFNELYFEDAAQQEKISIHAQKDMDTRVLNNRSTTVDNDHTENIGNRQSITVTGNQSLTVKQSRTVSITKNQSTSIGGSDTLAISAERLTGVGKNDTLMVKGHINVQSEEGSITLLTAGGYICINHNGVISIKGRHIIIDGDRTDLNPGILPDLPLGTFTPSQPPRGGESHSSITGTLTAALTGMLTAASEQIISGSAAPVQEEAQKEPALPAQETVTVSADKTDKTEQKTAMPGITILVHGVNDDGEAYENLEKGIIRGLNQRLGRSDLTPNTYPKSSREALTPGNSPVIPFYWGYKPVTHEDWREDQRRYREEVKKPGKEATLPYDAYQEDSPQKKEQLGNYGEKSVFFENDNFANVLEPDFARPGGTFVNATTNIPDMLGPGPSGTILDIFNEITHRFGSEDNTHPLFDNPHRIYQFFAARRLAELILKIRQEPATKKDVINIVAHSQGTIITMLACMLVKQETENPADCVIFNHSPYALEFRIAEDIMFGKSQTSDAHLQTFKNFCHLIASQNTDKQQFSQHSPDEIRTMEREGILAETNKHKWNSDLNYSRNNTGKVYNYFCTVDNTVSLRSVQGIGWSGIPQKFAGDIPNLRQRAFYQHGLVGAEPNNKSLSLPVLMDGDYKPAWYNPVSPSATVRITIKLLPGERQYIITDENQRAPADSANVINFSFTRDEIIVNGEALPEPFTFTLQGEGEKPAYTHKVDTGSTDEAISYSDKAKRDNDRYINKKLTHDEFRDAFPELRSKIPLAELLLNPAYPEFTWSATKGGEMPEPVRNLAQKYNYEIIFAKYINHRAGSDEAELSFSFIRKKTREELDKEWKHTVPVIYSQHSSIVMNKKVPELAMAFDLAVGQCKSFTFNDGKFWEELLHTANWRDPQNSFDQAVEYYKSGKLDEDTIKKFMNNPDKILPTGKFGVVNKFDDHLRHEKNAGKLILETYKNLIVPLQIKKIVERVNNPVKDQSLQWEMPKPLTDAEIDKE